MEIWRHLVRNKETNEQSVLYNDFLKPEGSTQIADFHNKEKVGNFFRESTEPVFQLLCETVDFLIRRNGVQLLVNSYLFGSYVNVSVRDESCLVGFYGTAVQIQ